MCGPKFCSMKITQNVRDYAKNQQNTETSTEQSAEIETGYQSMKDAYHAQGQKLYHKV